MKKINLLISNRKLLREDWTIIMSRFICRSTVDSSQAKHLFLIEILFHLHQSFSFDNKLSKRQHFTLKWLCMWVCCFKICPSFTRSVSRVLKKHRRWANGTCLRKNSIIGTKRTYMQKTERKNSVYRYLKVSFTFQHFF